MKNKIIGILITLIIMIGIMASQVMAATINASNTEVAKGEQITVTVNLDKETQAVDLVLNYDANSFEYVKGSINSTLGQGAMTVNDSEAGVVRLSASNAMASTKAVTYTFIAKENTEGATFTASGLVTESGETFDVDNVTVKVVEPAQEPENPGDQETPVTPEEPENPNTGATENNEQAGSQANSESQIVDEHGNVITKLPQTGITVFQIAGVVAVVAIAAVLVIRKIRK